MLEAIVEQNTQGDPLNKTDKIVAAIEDYYTEMGIKPKWYERIIYALEKKYNPEHREYKTKIGKWFAKKVLSPLMKFPVYAAAGSFLPGEKQTEIARNMGFKDNKFMSYSLTSAYIYEAVKFKCGHWITFIPVLGAAPTVAGGAVMAFSAIGALAITARAVYAIAAKKPIASLFWFELPYQLFKSGKAMLTRKLKKEETVEINLDESIDLYNKAKDKANEYCKENPKECYCNSLEKEMVVNLS